MPNDTQMLMITILLLLLNPVVISFEYCPCNTGPVECDLNCCCDIDCTVQQISSFTCQPFLLSDSNLCCKDSVKLVGSQYQNIRECNDNLICLDEIPSGFGIFSNNSKSVELQAGDTLEPGGNQFTYEESLQYLDTDKLLQRDSGDSSVQAFKFPVQFFGDLCAMSPVLFYSEVHSSCKRSIRDVNALCSSNQLLDYHFYLESLLKSPNKTSAELDLSSNVVFYCRDSSKDGIKELCTPTNEIPVISSGKCKNAVSDIEIRLKTATDTMTLESSTVSVTLTSFPTTQTTFTQTFTLTYTPESAVNSISGNFGYMPRSPLLSGTVSKDGSTVVMSSDPKMRLLSLFKSADCSVFSDHVIEFGIGFYTGCKLSLPFYNFQVMSEKQEKYCLVLQSLTDNIMKAAKDVVVGKRDISGFLSQMNFLNLSLSQTCVIFFYYIRKIKIKKIVVQSYP